MNMRARADLISWKHLTLQLCKRSSDKSGIGIEGASFVVWLRCRMLVYVQSLGCWGCLGPVQATLPS